MPENVIFALRLVVLNPGSDLRVARSHHQPVRRIYVLRSADLASTLPFVYQRVFPFAHQSFLFAYQMLPFADPGWLMRYALEMSQAYVLRSVAARLFCVALGSDTH